MSDAPKEPNDQAKGDAAKGDAAANVTDPPPVKAPDIVTPAGAASAEESVPATTEPQADVVTVRHGMFGGSGSGDTSGYGGLIRSVTMPPPTNRPYGGYFDEIADQLISALQGAGVDPNVAIEATLVDRDQLTFVIRKEQIVEVCQQLRDQPDLRFEMFSGVSGVHFPDDTGRELRAVYHLLSITHNRRLRLEVTTSDADRHIPSVVEVYPSADWHERETWDFFGIIFDGHPALTRIEMPDDWPGHPQRKDYPLGGIPVEYKGASIPPPDTRRSYS